MTVTHSVLVADDDTVIRKAVLRRLSIFGLTLYEASSGSEALHLAQTRRPDAAILALQLGDMTALEAVRRMHVAHIAIPWILMKTGSNIDVALQAGREGALKALETSKGVEDSVCELLQYLHVQRSSEWPRLPIAARMVAPRSIVTRAAWFIAKACDSSHDLPTISRWATFVGTSNTQLRDPYYRIGVAPHSARDFMRVLRALIRANGAKANVNAELDIRDYRTEATLLAKAGLRCEPSAITVPLATYLSQQSFVPADHGMIDELLVLLQ